MFRNVFIFLLVPIAVVVTAAIIFSQPTHPVLYAIAIVLPVLTMVSIFAVSIRLCISDLASRITDQEARSAFKDKSDSSETFPQRRAN